jgi:TP901 family phage tail tape measure protein
LGNLANLLVRVGTETGDFFKGMGSVVSKTGEVAGQFVKFGAAAGSAVVGVGIAAGKMAMDFQDQMADVATLIDGGPSEAMQRFGADVKRIAVLTGKDLSNVSEGLYETISAFGDTADAAKQLEIATKAAVGGKAETLDAVKLLSTVTKGYGDTSAAAVQKVADLAFQTANLGQTTFPELAASMGNTVPMANALGANVESLFGAFATLTGVTGNTAEVATQLKATFSSLLNPSSQMAATMSKLGFANGRTMIQSLGLQGTLDLLAKATGGNTAQLAKMFGSTEALNAVLALTGAQAQDFTAKTQAMTQADGASTTAFQEKTATVRSMLDRLKEMGTVALVSIGEQLLPQFQTMGEWVMANMPTIQAVLETAINVVGVVFQWLGGIVSWFVETVWKPFVAAWTGDTTAMQTPIGQFALAVQAVWNAITGWISGFRENIWNPFLEGWRTGSEGMGGTWQKIGALIGSITQSIWSIISGVWTLAVMYWNKWGDDFMAIAKTVWEAVLGVIDGALKIIDGIIKFFVSLFKGDWQGMADGLKEIWSGLWEILTAIGKAAVDLILIAVRAIWDGMVFTWNRLKDAATDLYNWYIDWATGLRDAAIQWGKDLMAGMWDGITSWFKKITDGLSDFANGIADKVKSALGIHSPSKVFAGIGANIGAGLAQGISGSADLVNRAVGQITPGGVDVAVQSVRPASDWQDAGSAAGAGGSEVHAHLHFNGSEAADFIIDTLTGVVRQPKRAMGTT